MDSSIRLLTIKALICADETDPEFGSDGHFRSDYYRRSSASVPASGTRDFDCDASDESWNWDAEVGIPTITFADKVEVRPLEQDRRARRGIEAAAAEERAVIEAYARGVNAGLSSLDLRPWEYLLLRASPGAWVPEDSVLVVHSMWWQLPRALVKADTPKARSKLAAIAQGDPDYIRSLASPLSRE